MGVRAYIYPIIGLTSPLSDTGKITVIYWFILILLIYYRTHNKDNYAFSLADDSSIEDQSHFSISCLLHEPYIFNVYL